MRMQTDHGQVLLSYSTNVHRGESLADVRRILATDVARVRDAVCPEGEFGVELRLGNAALQALQTPGAIRDLADLLASERLFVFSLNGFPLRDFHAARVKEEVYRPDWGEVERQQATVQLAHILAALLPEDLTGTISTAPGSYKPWGNHPALRAEIARGFAPAIHALHSIEREQGKRILLAVEPEPYCTCETVREFVDFVQAEVLTHTVQALVDEHGMPAADAHRAVQTHLGINLDACHLAATFEDPDRAVADVAQAHIPLAKVHVSAAARVHRPATNAEGMAGLRRLDEPRYLHQTFAVNAKGEMVFRDADLGPFLALPANELAAIAEVRTHYHMPLFAPVQAPLGTTSDITERVLHLALESGQTPHVATETYTWPLLDAVRPVHENIAAELRWVQERL